MYGAAASQDRGHVPSASRYHLCPAPRAAHREASARASKWPYAPPNFLMPHRLHTAARSSSVGPPPAATPRRTISPAAFCSALSTNIQSMSNRRAQLSRQSSPAASAGAAGESTRSAASTRAESNSADNVSPTKATRPCCVVGSSSSCSRSRGASEHLPLAHSARKVRSKPEKLCRACADAGLWADWARSATLRAMSAALLTSTRPRC
mmetsp:Transcript_5319/g.12912  ORF Transcript_5319/g.12912 Transcript_5319/m.12912 type:complete len:208 (+) Transcript_5319:74-697(+)